MPDDTRDKTGPLSARQKVILERLAEGKTYEQIGKEVGVSKQHIGRIVSNSLLPRMGCARGTAATSKYGRAQGLIQAAQRLKEGILPYPADRGEEHVNHVLEVLATELRRQANDLLP